MDKHHLKKSKDAKPKHSHLYKTERYMAGDLGRDEIYSMSRDEANEYVSLHFKGKHHDCRTCEVTHLVGGWCSEEDEIIEDPRPSSKLTRAQKRSHKN